MGVRTMTHTTKLRPLSDAQAEAFDSDYLIGSRWDAVVQCIDQDFPEGNFRFLDVGGGTGRFSDRLLARYPDSSGVVLDNSEMLLGRNLPDPRKRLVLASVERFPDHGFDLIAVHWLLHHLVAGSYLETRRQQLATLSALRERLTPRGRLSVFENMYQGWPWAEDLPGHLIYTLASSRALAPLTRRLGANTAGVGVCFLSRREGFEAFEQAGLRKLRYEEDAPWPLRSVWRLVGLREIRAGHAWLGR